MSIDWITVVAQIVNFLILVWLLKRFLYLPVTRAMDRREERIADRLNEARTREEHAEQEAQHFHAQSEELQDRRDEIMAEARLEAQHEKQQMLDDARNEVADFRSAWRTQAEEERDEFLEHLRHQAIDAIQAIARKALGDLADADLEEKMIDKFTTRLKGLDKVTRSALVASAGPMRIETSIELDSAARSRLTRAVHEHLGPGIEIDYLQAPELLCGIELTRGGRRLGWNMDEYLQGLGTRIGDAFAGTGPTRD